MTFRNFRFLAAVLAGSAVLVTNNVNADFVLGLKSQDAPDPVFGQIYHWTGASNPREDGIRKALESLGIDPDSLGSPLYKSEVSKGKVKEEGGLKMEYSTIYDPADGTGTATITWTGSAIGAKVADATFLLAKSGSKDGSYLWDVSKWDGIVPIVIQDVFNKNAFSHVEFYGVTSFHTTPVPEPSTIIGGSLLLLPFALSAYRNWRRRSGQA